MIIAVAYGAGWFIAPGYITTGRYPTLLATMSFSRDGEIFEAGANRLAATDYCLAAAYGNGVFLIGGSNGTVTTPVIPTAYATPSDLEDDTLAPSTGTFKYYLAAATSASARRPRVS